MGLPPDPDPEKYRTKWYTPNNSLLVQDSRAAGIPQVVERTLSELADRSSTKDCDRESETQALVKRKTNPNPKLLLAFEGKSVVVGDEDWDGVYHVMLDSP